MSDTTDRRSHDRSGLDHLREMPVQLQALMAHALSKDVARLSLVRTGMSDYDVNDDYRFVATEWMLNVQFDSLEGPTVTVFATPNVDDDAVRMYTISKGIGHSVTVDKLDAMIDTLRPAPDYGDLGVDVAVLDERVREHLTAAGRPVTQLAAWLTAAAAQRWDIQYETRPVSPRLMDTLPRSVECQLTASVADASYSDAYGVYLYEPLHGVEHIASDISTYTGPIEHYRYRPMELNEVIDLTTTNLAPGTEPLMVCDGEGQPLY